MKARKHLMHLFALAAVLGSAEAFAKPYLQRLESLRTESAGIYFGTGCQTSLDDWEYVLDADIRGDWGGANGRMQFQPAQDKLRHVYHVRTTAAGAESVWVDSAAPHYTRSWGTQFCNVDIEILKLGGYSTYQYGTVWSFQLLKNGELVRDMYPVLVRIADGDRRIYGLYDQVSGAVFEQQGSGTVIPGEIVPEPGDEKDEPEFSNVEFVSQADLSILCEWGLSGVGTGCDSAAVSVAWGYEAEALDRTNLLCEASAALVTTNGFLYGVPPESTVYMRLLAVNGNGFSTNTETVLVHTQPTPADTSYDCGSRSILSAEITGGQVRLTFAEGTTGGPHRLYALFGKTAGGAVRGDWEHVEFLAEIEDDVADYVCDLPSGWGEDVFALRFAFDLVDEEVIPYDAILDFIASDGNRQYIDTGLPGFCTADGGGIEYSADMMWIQVPGDGCFLGSYNGNRCYLIYSYPSRWNLGFGGGNYNDGYAPAANVRYQVEGVFHGGEQRIVANDETVVSRELAGPLTCPNLYAFALNDRGGPSAYAIARLYSLVLSENGAVRRDFVPCEKDGVGMLYDRVTRTAYQNKGTLAPFVCGQKTGGKVQFVPFSPTCLYRESTLPSFGGLAKTADEGAWATIVGRLAEFGGARESCKVRLYLGTENDVEALEQYGDDLTPEADGSFSFRAEPLTGGVEYFWMVEAEGESGTKARSPIARFTTRSVSRLTNVKASVVRSTVTVTGTLAERGAGPATVIFRVGTSADTALEKGRQVVSGETASLNFTWVGYLDGCDWDVPQYWDVLVVNEAGGNAWTNAYGQAFLDLQDSTFYSWTGNGVANADGSRNWGDAANWQPRSDTAEFSGHPTTSMANAEFPEDCEAVVRLDRVRSVAFLDLFKNCRVVLKGEAQTALTADRVRPQAGMRLTIDGAVVKISQGAVSPAQDGEFVLDHGAVLSCPELNLAPGNYGGSFRGTVSVLGESRLGTGVCKLGDEGAIVLENGTLGAEFYFDVNTGGGRLVIAGTNSTVEATRYFRGWNDENVVNPGRALVEFRISETGYVRAPIQANCYIGGMDDAIYARPLNFRVDPKSPVRHTPVELSVPLAEGTFTLNAAKLALSDDGVAGASWRYDPDATAPTRLFYDVPRAPGMKLLVR